MEKELKILLVSTGDIRYEKYGQLYDPVKELANELVKNNNEVVCVMPKYSETLNDFKEQKLLSEFDVHLDWRVQKVKVNQCNDKMNDVKYFLIDNDYYYNQANNTINEDEQAVFLSRATLEMLPKVGYKPDIIHCINWQTGLVCLYLKEQYKDNEFYSNIKTLFTISDIKNQGNFSKDVLSIAGLDESYYNYKKLEFFGGISFLKAGIKYCDVLLTVGENYAKEIQTISSGYGLDGLVREKSEQLFGILPGTSYINYLPEKDKYIYKKYSQNKLNLKNDNKLKFQKEMGLKEGDYPIVLYIGDLNESSGVRLIEESLEDILKDHKQLVILAKGDKYYENLFSSLSEEFKEQIYFNKEFKEIDIHKAYAAADILIDPFIYKSFDTNIYHAYKYGVMPVARMSSYVVDIVKPVCYGGSEGNGYTFFDYNVEEFKNALYNALEVYNTRREEWNNILIRNMNKDYSWSNLVRKYIAVYRFIKCTEQIVA